MIRTFKGILPGTWTRKPSYNLTRTVPWYGLWVINFIFICKYLVIAARSQWNWEQIRMWSLLPSSSCSKNWYLFYLFINRRAAFDQHQQYSTEIFFCMFLSRKYFIRISLYEDEDLCFYKWLHLSIIFRPLVGMAPPSLSVLHPHLGLWANFTREISDPPRHMVQHQQHRWFAKRRNAQWILVHFRLPLRRVPSLSHSCRPAGLSSDAWTH